MLVGALTVLESCRCMLLGVFVLAEIVMMLSLMVVMRSGMVMSGGLVMMLAGGMLGCLCHFTMFLL